MRLSKLNLVNYRNYSSLSLDPQPGINVIRGINGQGKSNLLEAIYMLSIGKSLRTGPERNIIPRRLLKNGGISQIVGLFSDKSGSTKAQVDMELRKSNTGQLSLVKYFRLNAEKQRAAEFVGSVKMCFFSVNDVNIVLGGAETRRRYLDILMAQINRADFKNLQHYSRSVSQRNGLLRAQKQRKLSSAELNNELKFWDDRVAREATPIIINRNKVINELLQLAIPIHRELGGQQLEIVYRPNLLDKLFNPPSGRPQSEVTPEQVRLALMDTFRRMRPAELKRGYTLVGPHRDDFEIRLNGEPAELASRGQARLVAVALKMAEANYIVKAIHNSPVILLDDVFSELDSSKRDALLKMLKDYEQVLITTAEDDGIYSDYTQFSVVNGVITPFS